MRVKGKRKWSGSGLNVSQMTADECLRTTAGRDETNNEDKDEQDTE